MPKSCCVTFCTSNKLKNFELKFIRLPNKATQPARRTQWLQAIRREDTSGRLWNPSSQHVYVCSLHFVTGSTNEDKTHPDYIPSLFPNRGNSQSSAVTKVKRVNRRRKRELLSPVSQGNAVRTTPTAQQDNPEPSPEHEPDHSETPGPVPLQDLENNLEKQLHEEIYNLRRERDEARKERDELTSQVQLLKFSADSVRDDDTACKTMTGLSWTLFESLHQFLQQFLKPRAHAQFKWPTEDQLFFTLVKLRQNPSNCLMCRVLALAESTYLDMFSRWLDLMYAKLAFLVAWPDRDCIRNTIPAPVVLQYPRLTSIIDCFEIRIEHSKTLKTRATTYSNYKNWTTVKYFIACHPAGQITYLSKGWGGRASDVHIVRKSGFLSKDYHHPGDQILADRGFTLKDEFAVLGAELVTPSFTLGRKQLSAEDVSHSRLTSNVRIHIERVIGVLKGRFHILDGPLPLRLVKRQTDEQQGRGEALIDRIVHVCGALVNMSGSIMYTDS